MLVVVTLLDLPLVLLFPESPPRFAQASVVDYMATRDILFSGGSRDPHVVVNLLAAMPSMHVAWTTWCGYAGWTVLRSHRPGLARSAWLLPLLTAVVVVLTGHHYVLDVLAGVLLVAVVAWLVGRFGPDRRTHVDPAPASPG